MHHFTRLLLAAGASTLITGCLATQSQFKHASDINSQQLAQERSARAASDSALAQQLGMVQGDVQKLRADLDAMRSEFNAKITAMEDGLHFALPVTFNYDDATLKTDEQPAIARFTKIAQSYYPGSKITVEGFADPAGSARYNLNLSKRRAETVRQALVAQGLTSNEIEAVGYGKTRLVTPGAAKDAPGAELNRRVVFVIESKGQSSVAMAPDSAASQPRSHKR